MVALWGCETGLRCVEADSPEAEAVGAGPGEGGYLGSLTFPGI